MARIAPKLPSEHIVLMNLCGRGDKDIFSVAEALGDDLSAAPEALRSGEASHAGEAAERSADAVEETA